MSSSSPNQWYFLTEEVDANISSFVMHHIAFGENLHCSKPSQLVSEIASLPQLQSPHTF